MRSGFYAWQRRPDSTRARRDRQWRVRIRAVGPNQRWVGDTSELRVGSAGKVDARSLFALSRGWPFKPDSYLGTRALCPAIVRVHTDVCWVFGLHPPASTRSKGEQGNPEHSGVAAATSPRVDPN